MGDFSAREAGGRLLLLLLPVLVYANSLQNPFHYDDAHSIVDNPHIRDLGKVPAFFVDPTLFSVDPDNAMYRPLLLTSFALNYAISGYQVWSYHLVGLALHLGCVYLLFLIGGMLLKNRLAAGLAALIFGVHPVNSETLNYISSRSEVLAGFFVLLGVWAFLRWRQGQGSGVVVVAAYLAGLLSKSVAMVLPAVLLGYDVLFTPGTWRRHLRLYSALGLVGGGYLAAVWSFLRKASIEAPVRPYSEQFWTQVKALVFYIKLLLWPRGLNVDHQFLISDSLLDPFAASAFLFILSLLALAFYHRQRHPLLLFLLFFGLMTLAPASLIPLNVLVNEHRLYLPSAAFALALSYAGGRLAQKGLLWKRGVTGLAVLLLVFYASTTVSRNQVWQSEYTLWRDAAAKAPLMARPYFYLGKACASRGQGEAAIAAFEHALRRDPALVAAYVLLGQLYQERGAIRQAEQIFRKGLEKEPGEAALWKGLAEVFRQQGKMEESLRAYREAVQLNPEDDGLHNNLGNTLQALGRPEEALTRHRQALALNPDDARTFVNLGGAHFMMEDLEAARAAFVRAVELDSLFAMAWYNLGFLYQKRGEREAALEAYRKAAGLDRDYAELLRERLQDLQESPHE